MSQHGGKLPPLDSLRSILPLRAYRYTDISRIAIHRRGNIGVGFLIGASVGVALGFMKGSSVEADIFYISAGVKAIT